MSTSRGVAPLSYRRIGRSELAVIGSLVFDPDQTERFLGPLPDIIDAVRRGLAHSMVGVEVSGQLAGFYVVHPDRRDRACWWLGWFAIDRRFQGCGYGQEAMAAIMAHLRRLHGCRAVRLLVAPENAHALRLYGRAGFRRVGVWAGTGEWVMECRQPVQVPAETDIAGMAAEDVVLYRMRSGAWGMDAPPAAYIHGATHGPPGATVH